MSKRHFFLRLLSLMLVMLLVGGLCACGEEPDSAPLDHEATAERFIEAYYLRDMATRFSLTFYNARQKWEDETIAYQGSEEEFFAEAQKQADEKGIEADIHSFDDYFAAYYKFIQQDCQATYGDYTVTTEVTESTKMDADTFATFCDSLLGAIDEKYIDGDALRAVTEAYTLNVHIQIDGTLKDYSESYLVHMVLHEGKWLVASHSV